MILTYRARRYCEVGDIPQDKLLIDSGDKTIAKYEQIIREAAPCSSTGRWVFNKASSAAGIKAIWEASVETKCFSVAGGGDSVAAANLFAVASKAATSARAVAHWSGSFRGRNCPWLRH